MIKKTITFEDYNGNQRTEDAYFNLTKTELVRMDVANVGGLHEYMQNAIDKKDAKSILEVFEMFVSKSYGIKTEDGLSFMKNPELTEKFMNSAAYDALLMELITNQDKAEAFLKGIVPKDLNVE